MLWDLPGWSYAIHSRDASRILYYQNGRSISMLSSTTSIPVPTNRNRCIVQGKSYHYFRYKRPRAYYGKSNYTSPAPWVLVDAPRARSREANISNPRYNPPSCRQLGCKPYVHACLSLKGHACMNIRTDHPPIDPPQFQPKHQEPQKSAERGASK